MLTKKEVTEYHLSDISKENRIGFEYEIFCLNEDLNRVFYSETNSHETSLHKIFENTIKEFGFENLDIDKTIGITKNGNNFTLEPGSQLEYSANYQDNITPLIHDFLKFVNILLKLKRKFRLEWLDISVFPTKNHLDIPSLPKERYQIMEKYFKQSGSLGHEMMKNTTSLQITFNYKSLEDLEMKVNRLLLAKPILLAISSNSRIKNGCDTKCRSYRSRIWNDVDPLRCNDPGNNFWIKGYWSLDDYIEKVLNAPTIFDVVSKNYSKSGHLPFREYIMSADANIESYIFHNSTIFTDIRIKNYIELRYLDNPTILLTPGLLLLVDSLVNDDIVWNKFQSMLPYQFSDVPKMTEKLNEVTPENFYYWDTFVKDKLIGFLDFVKSNLAESNQDFLNLLIDKVSRNESININHHKTARDYADQFSKSAQNILEIANSAI